MTTITTKLMTELEAEFALTDNGVKVVERQIGSAIAVRFEGPRVKAMAQRRKGDKFWAVFINGEPLYLHLKRSDALAAAAQHSLK